MSWWDTHEHTDWHKYSLKCVKLSLWGSSSKRDTLRNSAGHKLKPLSGNLLAIIYSQIGLEMNTCQPAKWIQKNASLHLSEVVLSHNSPPPNPPIPMNTMLWCVLQPLACCDAAYLLLCGLWSCVESHQVHKISVAVFCDDCRLDRGGSLCRDFWLGQQCQKKQGDRCKGWWLKKIIIII